ncbi:MAG: PAS domain S-box protein [Pseudodesulfovibrio sp.]
MVRRSQKWTCMLVVFMTLTLCCGLGWAQRDRALLGTSFIELSREERAWLKEHKDLRLGMWLGSAPNMFRGDDGSMQGIIPSYIDVVIKKLGLTPKRVRASSFVALWELAKAGEVDVVAAVTAAPERSNAMLLSEPYIYMPIVIVTRSDFPFITGLGDLGGRTVAVGAGHVPHLRIPQEYPDIILMPVGNQAQGIQAVDSGLADAYVADQVTLTHISRQYGITNLRIAAITEYSYKLSVGVRKDWPILQTLVNRALASITEEERKSIQDYWTVLRDSQWVDRPNVWRLVGGVTLAAAALLGWILFWNRKLAQEVERRKRAEEKSRRAHEETKQVIESADVIIVGLDYTGHVRLFNRAGETITGYSRDEIMGKNWFDIVVPRERYSFVWDEFARLISDGPKGMAEAFENPVLTKSGETRQILWRNSIAAEDNDELAVISFGTDITHRLQAEEELRLTQFAMDNAAVGVFRFRPSGRIVYTNRAAASLLGYTRSELKRMLISDISSDYTQDSWPDFWERLKYNRMLTLENVALHKDGSVIPVEVTAYYLMFKGTELIIGFFSDISERKRVEILRDDVERMVRHDLRSPTIAVQALFTLLKDAKNLTEDQHELLESVMNSSRRMINIIDMSRALYSMEAGTYVLNPVPVDLLPLALSVTQDLGPLTRVKKVDVVVQLEGEPASATNTFVALSEEMLCYALLANLLKNAVEASPDGDTVTVGFSMQENYFITVHNSGIIPEDIRESFFEKYVTEGKTYGTGLGTYTARLIVTSLGGTIDFTTSEIDGTTIFVSLPLNNNTHS